MNLETRMRTQARPGGNPGPQVAVGTPASPGYASGTLFRLDRDVAAYQPKGSPDGEKAALQAAIGSAMERVDALAAAASGEAAEILEFQTAMLGDDSLAEAAFAAIAAGQPADASWRAALNDQIAGYEASEEEYFRARAADLRDIRDQVLRALSSTDAESVPAGALLFGADITPTIFLETDWSQGGGIALTAGSPSSHVAMLARSRGVPMVVGIGDVADDTEGFALLDAEGGTLTLNPSEDDLEKFQRFAGTFLRLRKAAEANAGKPAATRNGTPVRVQVNVADPSDVDRIDVATCDGVGLMRSEFLFNKGLPDEETQYVAYRKVLEWAAGRPVTIRTIDAGGDKPIAGFTVEEGNPFLGLRGIRLSLARPEIFRVQIRALLRAAVHGKLKVMFPMIALPDEYDRSVALFRQEAAALAAAGLPHAMPPLGIMVEVPSVAIAPEAFAHVAFFSIGSNDLTQYVMAAARDNTSVAHLNSVRNPAVLRLIASVAKYGADHGIPVSLCGDAGGDPASIPALLEAGLRDLSVVPAQLAVAKAAIADVAI
jgi:phosphotransferase system enzyme I (PtsI)